MLRNYLKVARRNFLADKVHSLVNIFSLAVGMGVCLLIYQYIHFELSYDKFHDNFQNTYRVIIEETRNGVERSDPYTGYAVGVSAKQEIPEIEQYVRMHKYFSTMVTNPANNKAFHEEGLDLLFVDSTFFHVFDFPLKLGSKESVFAEKFNIVITETTAEKYFGSENPIGKMLKVSAKPSPGNYIVSGVLEELPINSNLKFEFLLPIENYLSLGWGGAVKQVSDGWVGWQSFVTYLTLDESADPNLVQEKLDQLIAKYQGERNANENIVEKAMLQPIADIHLKSKSYSDEGYVLNKGTIKDVRVFSIIAFFILFIAWVNYINLSTARSMRRAKEVGIRKVIGAFRKQLIGQFMMESVLINFVSAILAVGIAILTLPVLSQIVGEKLALSVLQTPEFWVGFLVVIVFGSFLSGVYPALVLSAFKPISILGSNKSAQSGNFNLRKGLIAFQFLTSVLLISGTYLIYKQITFMKNQELGMDMEKILVLKGPEVDLDGVNLRSTFDSFKNEVESHHSISAVAGSVFIPGQVNNTSTASLRKVGVPESEAPYGRGIYVGLDFPETYGLEFIAGGSFTPEMSDYEPVLIINEEAVHTYGLGSPEDAINEELMDEEGTYKIIGVVKNFHWHSLRDAHTSYVFWPESTAHSYISFKMNLSNIPESLEHIQTTYSSFFPNNPFDYFFLEDEFNKQYQSDMRFGNLFFAFTALAIFIACIGLFSLVSYSATLKTKEIGIRKVLGASTSNLMMMLSREYILLLLVANILAIPAMLYWGRSWLENYAFKTNLSIELFLIPGLIITLISLLTVSHRTYYAAKANPVNSLRAE